MAPRCCPPIPTLTRSAHHCPAHPTAHPSTHNQTQPPSHPSAYHLKLAHSHLQPPAPEHPPPFCALPKQAQQDEEQRKKEEATRAVAEAAKAAEERERAQRVARLREWDEEEVSGVAVRCGAALCGAVQCGWGWTYGCGRGVYVRACLGGVRGCRLWVQHFAAGTLWVLGKRAGRQVLGCS